MPQSVTGKYLSGASKVDPVRPFRPARARRGIKITGCSEHNLKNLTVDFPLDRFVVVTGVSGSGKSTLVHKTLHNALSKIFYRDVDVEVGRYENLYGADLITGVVLLDQSPIGKSSRSNPATYLKAWDEIRKLLAGLPDAEHALQGFLDDTGRFLARAPALLHAILHKQVDADKLPEGKKSLAIEVVLQPRERTLTDAEIEAAGQKVVAAVAKATGAVLAMSASTAAVRGA